MLVGALVLRDGSTDNEPSCILGTCVCTLGKKLGFNEGFKEIILLGEDVDWFGTDVMTDGPIVGCVDG